MSRGINKAIIVGRLGQDPETRYTANGAAITNISVATSEEWKDKQSGEKQSRTEWHKIVFFNRLAEVAGEYLRKGSQVYIEGKIQTLSVRNTSGYLGVYLNKSSGRWAAQIKHKGKKHWLGYHNTPEAAHRAYCDAKKRIHQFCPSVRPPND